MGRKKNKGPAASSSDDPPKDEEDEGEEVEPPKDEEEGGEDVSDEALAKIEARLQARMEARLEKVESKVNEVAKTETIELDPLEEDEEEPTFQSRVVPLLSSIPHAETAYAKLAPHAATAWERVKQGAAQAREHTKDYEEQAKEALAPVTAAVAPHVATAKSMISRALQLSDPVLVEALAAPI